MVQIRYSLDKIKYSKELKTLKGIVYKITNLINNKCYIGISMCTFLDRYRSGFSHCKNDYLLYSINKYGKENVISAYVHLDETSPHMHFCFVPVVFDTKKQEYKVNAKVCINRTELLKIHPQMQEYLESKLQTKVNILNGATAEGNKTIEQLKKEEKIKKAAIKELVKNPTEEIKTAVIEQLPEEQKETIVEQEIEIVKEELKKDPQFIQICKNKAMSEIENIEELKIKIENLSTKKRLFRRKYG